MRYTPTTNGAVIYRGPSQLDGRTPIVAIATGLKRPSRNPKTGPMIQTWILRQRIAPHVAAHTGKDTPICGDCPLTKLVDRFGERIRARRCYVDTSNAPNQIWKAWRGGSYSEPANLAQLGQGRSIRLGAYGDPTAVPYRVWRDLLRDSVNWTGYTHSWRIGRFWRFRQLVMASCETYADHLEAKSKNWRTFQTGHDIGPDQIFCPSSQGITCEKCGLCKGTAVNAKSIVIPPHGGKAILHAWANVAQ